MSIQNQLQFSTDFHALLTLYNSRKKDELEKSWDSLSDFFRQKVLDQIGELSSRPIGPNLKILAPEDFPRLRQTIYLIVSKNFPLFEKDQKDFIKGSNHLTKDASPLIEIISSYTDETELAELIKKGSENKKDLIQAICDFSAPREQMSLSAMRKVRSSAIERLMLEQNSTHKKALTQRVQLTEFVLEVLFSFPKSQRVWVKAGLTVLSFGDKGTELWNNLKKMIARILISRSDYIKPWSDYVLNNFVDGAAKPYAPTPLNTWVMAEQIQNFGIQEYRDLVEIAVICAQADPEQTAKHIQDFGIRNEEDLMELATICAKKNPWAALQYIQNFNIQEQSFLIRIAMSCALENSWALVRSIKNFGIKDQEALIQIAMVCVQQRNGLKVGEHIENFGIKSEQALLQIALLCVQQDGEGTVKYIKNFGIRDPQALFEIRSACLFQLYATLSIEGFNKRAEMLLAPYREEPLPPGVSDAFEVITRRSDLERAQLFFLYLHQKRHFFKHRKELTVEENNVFRQTSKYRNRTLANELSFSFQRILSDPQALTNYWSACGKQLNKAPLTYLYLPFLLLSEWSFSADDMKPIRELIQLHKTAFKNAGNQILQAWLLISLALNRSSLSAQRKLKLFQQACASLESANPLKDLSFRLSIISSLIDFSQEDQCDKDFSANMTQELSTILEKVLMSSYPFLEGIEGISENYLNTLGSMRIPLAWVTYLRGLDSLNDPEVEQEAQDMIRCIIGDTYLTERARTDKSLHLQLMANKHPELFEAWQLPPCFAPYTPSIQKGGSLSFDFIKFLKEKCADGHFKGAEAIFSPLKDFLENGRQETGVDQHEAVRICIALCQNPEGIEAKLEQLLIAVAELPRTEFHRDIEDLLKSLYKDREEGLLEVGDTNHWHDLFLSGNEVLGSCQRVDGLPDINKCLLSCVMDSKIRMVFLREKISGKLLARALFKLLFAEEDFRPVLFLDRIYPPGCPPEWGNALVDFARKRAKALGCELTTQEPGWGTREFSGKILSLGSRSPYEYEDAIDDEYKNGEDGVKRGGVFRISGNIEVIE